MFLRQPDLAKGSPPEGAKESIGTNLIVRVEQIDTLFCNVILFLREYQASELSSANSTACSSVMAFPSVQSAKNSSPDFRFSSLISE